MRKATPVVEHDRDDLRIRKCRQSPNGRPLNRDRVPGGEQWRENFAGRRKRFLSNQLDRLHSQIFSLRVVGCDSSRLLQQVIDEQLRLGSRGRSRSVDG